MDNDRIGDHWLDDVVGLTCPSGTVRLVEYDGCGAFTMPNGRIFDSKTNAVTGDSKGVKHGVVCHHACKNLVESLGFPVTFAELYGRVGPAGLLRGCKKRYATISRYHLQNFEMDDVFENHDEWLLADPSLPNTNRARIIRLWNSIMNTPPRCWKTRW